MRAGLSYEEAMALPIGIVRDIIAVMIHFSSAGKSGDEHSVKKIGGKKVYTDTIPSVR